MLILVGVTINVALNGGLFGNAKKAAQKTEEQAISEQIIELLETGEFTKVNRGAFNNCSHVTTLYGQTFVNCPNLTINIYCSEEYANSNWSTNWANGVKQINYAQ